MHYHSLLVGIRKVLSSLKVTHIRAVHTHTHPQSWTALSKTTDRLSLSSMSELVSQQSHSGGADPWTMSLSASNQWWYTDKPSQWTDLSGKWSCVRSHSLFLQRSMSTGTRIATCWLTRAGTASWVDYTDDQSTLTMACSCCAWRSIPNDIQCSSKRHACCHRDVAWDHTVVGAWTAWPSDFEDHPSLVSHSDLSETNKLPTCCPVIL